MRSDSAAWRNALHNHIHSSRNFQKNAALTEVVFF